MKLFVWDFHGVLEDGTEKAVKEVSNQALERFGYTERFNDIDMRRLYGHKWYSYFEHLLPQESHDRHIELQSACFEISDANFDVIAKHIHATPHAAEVLDAISRQHEQILISNTRPTALRQFLEAVNLSQHFPVDKVIGVNAHVSNAAHPKVDALSGYISGRKFDAVISVGDSAKDMELGNVRYLYSHPHLPHREVEADYRISDLRDVLREI